MNLPLRLSTILGNFLEHYDSALFGLIIPFIAPLFFPQNEPVIALILSYSLLPLGLITRPLGALCFGWIGDRIGRKQALFYSLLGMSLMTMAIGFLPTHPLYLAFGRMFQSFFAAGETTGGAIFVLEHTQTSKRSLLSSLYDVSSMGGVMLASSLVALLSQHGWIETYWRCLFWGGGLTALVGLVLRLQAHDSLEFIRAPKEKISLKSHLLTLFSVTLVCGFSHVTYALAFTLMNGYVPLISSVSKTEVIQGNTKLLLFDLIILPCFGYLAHRIGKEKMMLMGSLGASLFALPLFGLLEGAPLSTVYGVRIAMIILGVAFAAPYHAWSLEQVSPHHRYLILSLGSALGSQLIGAPSSAICLSLYKMTGWVASPGLYFALTGSCASFVLLTHFLKKERALADSTP